MKKFILWFVLFLVGINANASFSRDATKQIVTDSISGLVWQDDEAAETIQKNWEEAGAYCESLSLGGFNDWRLPSIDELNTITDYSKYGPALNSAFVAFPNDSYNNYWSSTADASTSVFAWFVSAGSGGVDSYFMSTTEHHVRCVRAGQFGSFDNLAALKNAGFSRDAVKQIVTDSKSGLMWQDDEAAETTNNKEWEEAGAYCENLSFGGFDDWRLPSIDEFKTIIDYSKYSTALNSAFINSTTLGYWSSTADAGHSSAAYFVFASFGDTIGGLKSNNYNARCVRGGQPSDSFVNLLFKNAPTSTPSNSLSLGWNLLGATTTKTVEELKNANQNISIMWKYKNGAWQTTYSGTLPNGVTQMTDVEAGEGFWVLVK